MDLKTDFMKLLNHRVYLVISLFTAVIVSCQKHVDIPEKQLNTRRIELTDTSSQKVLITQQNGVGIEFCLLNEEGEPSTVFYEGENFRFHLAITNNVKPDTSMYILIDFLRNPNLFMVFRSDEDTIGKPVLNGFCYKCGSNFNEIKQGISWTLEIPWQETHGTELPFDINNGLKVFQCYLIGLNRSLLPVGKYYTELKQQFCLGHHLPDSLNKLACTDDLQLKIRFEIK